MNDEQAIALSDASEHLVYAYVSGDQRAIDAAKAEIRRAKQLGAGTRPSDEVLKTLIHNDPMTAAAVGLLTFPELQEIVASDLDSYLTEQELSAVSTNPANLRIVLAARITGDDVSDLIREKALDSQGFALAARGSRKRAAELSEYLHSEIDRLHGTVDQ